MKFKVLKTFYSSDLGRFESNSEVEITEEHAKPLVRDGFLSKIEKETKPKKEEKLEVKPQKQAKTSKKAK